MKKIEISVDERLAILNILIDVHERANSSNKQERMDYIENIDGLFGIFNAMKRKNNLNKKIVYMILQDSHYSIKLFTIDLIKYLLKKEDSDSLVWEYAYKLVNEQIRGVTTYWNTVQHDNDPLKVYEIHNIDGLAYPLTKPKEKKVPLEVHANIQTGTSISNNRGINNEILFKDL